MLPPNLQKLLSSDDYEALTEPLFFTFLSFGQPMKFTQQEIIDHIELNWPWVTDPQHCSAFLLKAETYAELDSRISYYERHLHD